MRTLDHLTRFILSKQRRTDFQQLLRHHRITDDLARLQTRRHGAEIPPPRSNRNVVSILLQIPRCATKPALLRLRFQLRTASAALMLHQ
jgi:hypothetical protein